MTAVNHFRSSARVSTTMRTTPPATSRADTSLTGFGNVNSWRTMLRDSVLAPLVAMAGSLSSPGIAAPGPNRRSQTRLVGFRMAVTGRPPLQAAGTGCGGGGPRSVSPAG